VRPAVLEAQRPPGEALRVEPIMEHEEGAECHVGSVTVERDAPVVRGCPSTMRKARARMRAWRASHRT
jgi:hypothetical protein